MTAVWPCPGRGRPHTAQPIAKMNKVKDLALILLISVLAYQVFIFCQKHLKQSFCYTLLPTHTALTEVFIFSGKSSCWTCCNGTFAIYIAPNNEYLK